MKTANGENLGIKGQAYLPFTFNGVVKIVSTLIVPKLAIDCICRMDFWRTFNIQPTIDQCALLENHQSELTTQNLPPPLTVLTEAEEQKL